MATENEAKESPTTGAMIVSRTLPNYTTRAEKWTFMRDSYIGGKEYINQHLFQYYIEGNDEFAKRQERAHRENHVKRVIDLFNSYLFQEEPIRDTTNTRLKDFHANIDGRGKSISQFMRLVSLWSAVYGRIYVMVDKQPIPDEDRTGTAADDLNPKAEPYCFTVPPTDIMDIAFNEDGSCKWVILVEHVRDDADPFTATGEIIDQYRLWSMDGWFLFDDKGNKVDEGVHGLKCVPIVIIDNEDADKYDGQSLVGDIAYLDRAIFNNWSRLDAIVCDQTFSQLIFPIEGMITDLLQDDKLREKFMTVATNRILLYSSQATVPPSFISPDASQAQFILTMIESQTKQLYASLGLKGETGVQVTSESGTAKAWDFDKLNKMLSNKADNLEQGENRINEMFAKWIGAGEIECNTDYPESFDVRNLADEIAIVQELALLRVSETFTKEIEKILAQKALPKIDETTMKKIMKEIDEKQEELPPPTGATFDFDEEGNPVQPKTPKKSVTEPAAPPTENVKKK